MASRVSRVASFVGLGLWFRVAVRLTVRVRVSRVRVS